MIDAINDLIDQLGYLGSGETFDADGVTKMLATIRDGDRVILL